MSEKRMWIPKLGYRTNYKSIIIYIPYEYRHYNFFVCPEWFKHELPGLYLLKSENNFLDINLLMKIDNVKNKEANY